MKIFLFVCRDEEKRREKICRKIIIIGRLGQTEAKSFNFNNILNFTRGSWGGIEQYLTNFYQIPQFLIFYSHFVQLFTLLIETFFRLIRRPPYKKMIYMLMFWL